MQLFVDSLYEQCNQYKLKTELIIVEWNPLPDKASLKEALSWPVEREYMVTRIVTVSPEIHATFKHADKMPIFQMIGKNVGIIRAKGRFILATNIDILFSDELIQFISKKKLKEGCHYRVDRVDVDTCVLMRRAKDNLLSLCGKNIIRYNKKYGTYDYRELKGAIPVFVKRTQDFVSRIKVFLSDGYPLIHSNACGDFACMAKKNWISLGGYAELEMYSFHIDSIILILGHYSGIREIDLRSPMEIYHIEHSSGSGWTPGGGEQKLFERLKSDSIPYLVWEDLLQYARDLRHTRDPTKTIIGNNKPSWGLGDRALPETIIR
ncbi:hypothetical protein [Methanoregula formicica]|nr:hypothetical protein [Methanoregula formicica]